MKLETEIKSKNCALKINSIEKIVMNFTARRPD